MRKNLSLSFKKITLALGVTLLTAGLNTTKAQTGAALSFDGVNDFVDCGIAVTNTLKGKDKFTVEAWIYPTQNAVGKSVIGNHQANTQFNIQQTTTNQFNFFIGFGAYGVMTAPNTVTLNTWHHVAGVFDDNVLKIYLNGVLANTTAVSPAYVLDVNCAINLFLGKSGFGGEEFMGNLDEVRIWDTARTSCQINTFMNCEIPSNAPNLLVNYHFNQGVAAANNATVNILNDATSNATNGTLTNLALNGAISNWVTPGGVVSGFTTTLAPPNVTVTANPALSTCQNNTIMLTGSGASTYTWSGGVTNAVAFTATASTVYTLNFTAPTGCTNTAVASVTTNNCPGEALSFDGTDYVEKTSATGLPQGNTPRTMEAWVNTSYLASSQVVLNWGNITNNQRSGIIIEGGTGKLYFVGENNDLSGGPNVADGSWHHVAVVYSGGNTGTLTLYVDGNDVVSAVKNLATNGTTLRIGMRAVPQTGEYFRGRLDEVRIWNVARTKCELNTFKNCEIPSTSTGLVANYHFNHGVAFAANATVTTLTDDSGSGNNGTLNTFALTAGNVNSNWVAPGAVSAGYTTAIAAPGYTNTALTICSGGTVVLGSTNATSYTWTPSITDNVPFTPTASTTYNYAGTNSVTSCSNTATIGVTVNPSPTVMAVTNTSILCVGQTASITASGATTYTWNTSSNNTVIAVSPTTTTSYTVTGTDGNGCENTAVVTQSVSSCTGLAEVNGQLNNVLVYPNPFKDTFTIESSNINSTVYVYNMLGALVQEVKMESNKVTINLHALNNGIYFVKIGTDIIKVIKE
ncbi:MAG: LamG-like jellyroll fold domain-containing protein [Bacteroidia bacterium]